MLRYATTRCAVVHMRTCSVCFTHETPVSLSRRVSGRWRWRRRRNDDQNGVCRTARARDQVENTGMPPLGKIDWLPRFAVLSGLTLRTSGASKRVRARRAQDGGRGIERDGEGRRRGREWRKRPCEREKRRLDRDWVGEDGAARKG